MRRPNNLACALVGALVALGAYSALHAQIPSTMNHQGILKVDGVPFTGSGQFKFGLYDGATSLWLWTNDGTQLGTDVSNAPTASVSLTLTDGVYNVLLGDTGITNMVAIGSSVFDDDDVRLRVYFNDGSNGQQTLSPDQSLSSVAYSFSADSAATASVALNAQTLDGLDSTDFAAQTDVDDVQSTVDGVTTSLMSAVARMLTLNDLPAETFGGNMVIEPFTSDSGIDSGSTTVHRGDNQDVVVSGTVLLLDMDGSNASTSFPDSSNSAHTVTANGNVQVTTSIGKFSQSAVFDGASGSYMSIPDSSDFEFGDASKMTVDFWVRFDSVGHSHTFLSQDKDGSNRFQFYWNAVTGELTIFSVEGGISFSLVGTWSPSTATWYHVAFAYGQSGTTWSIFADGAEIASGLGSQPVDTADLISENLNIGRKETGDTEYLEGHLDEFRITVGETHYTGAFVPPSGPYSIASSGKLITIAYAAASAPGSVLVSSNSTANSGAIAFYGSRIASPGTDFNNTNDWVPLTAGSWTDISSLASGTSVRIGALITNDAELDDLMFAWE